MRTANDDQPRQTGGNLIGYVDCAYGDCQETRRSTAGYVFLLGGGAVSWKSRRQQTIALSTVEAEYMAATQGAKETIWVRRLLTEIGRSSLTSHDSRLLGTRQRTHSDGYQGALDLAKNPQFHDKTKHIDIQQHWIREVLEAKKDYSGVRAYGRAKRGHLHQAAGARCFREVSVGVGIEEGFGVMIRGDERRGGVLEFGEAVVRRVELEH
jgi:hypothetical protein